MGKCKAGFKMKNGKCSKVKGSSSGKKGFNPFKMWGSYVGAVTLPILLISIIHLYLSSNFSFWNVSVTFKYIFLALIFQDFTFASSSETTLIPSILIYSSIILGFLIGWGIHSIFRSMRNRRK